MNKKEVIKRLEKLEKELKEVKEWSRMSELNRKFDNITSNSQSETATDLLNCIINDCYANNPGLENSVGCWYTTNRSGRSGLECSNCHRILNVNLSPDYYFGELKYCPFCGKFKTGVY